MRFTIASAVVAFAASALAQTEGFDAINIPEENQVIPAGSTFEVKWDAPATYLTGTISISLIGGADQGSLQPIAEIDSGVANNAESYQWTVDASLGDEALYGLVFKLDSNPGIFQYSKPFKIGAGEGKGKNTGKTTKYLTTAHGVQTVTLSSCPPSSTSTFITTTRAQNTTISHPATTKTKSFTPSSVFVPPPPPPSVTPIAPPPPPPPAPTPEQPQLPTPEPTVPQPTPEPPAPTAAGAHLVAGPMALIGGLAIALAL
jgi:hypothetical protein